MMAKPSRHSRAPQRPLGQIHADGFRFPRLRIDANFKFHSFALGDFVAVSQCRDVKENVNTTVIRFDETKPSTLVEHLNFASWHAILQVFPCCQLRTEVSHKSKDGPKTQ